MSRTPSTRGLVAVTLAASASLAVGWASLSRPDLVFDLVPGLDAILSALDPGTVLLVAVLALVLFGSTIGIAGKFRPTTVEPLTAANAATERRLQGDRGRRVIGEQFDRYVDRATAYDDEPREVREHAGDRLVESVRPIAATAYANRAGVSREAATEAIEEGTWTDDRRAAAFLAGESGPSTPVWLWLFDLLTGADPFIHALERTIDEIEALQSTPSVRSMNGTRHDGPTREEVAG
ncbi:hypothetical protein ACLI4Z_01775 [Natrialbaceae archaeon A-arb3/5]